MDITGGNPPFFKKKNHFPDIGNSQCKVIRQEHAQCVCVRNSKASVARTE